MVRIKIFGGQNIDNSADIARKRDDIDKFYIIVQEFCARHGNSAILCYSYNFRRWYHFLMRDRRK